MKRMICICMAVILCFAMACPVFAATGDFVPSISYKDTPDLVPFDDGNGGQAIGSIRDANGSVVSYAYDGCLVLTPVSEAQTSTQIPAQAAQQLLDVYNGILNGSMQIPFDTIDPALKPDEMVIRDLFDASWLCSDHPDVVAAANIHVQVTFDMDIDADAEIYGMVYINDQTSSISTFSIANRQTPGKQWVPIENLVNNGDGTITCDLEDVGVIAFAVHNKKPPVQTGDPMGKSIYLWIGLMAVSAAAIVVLVVSNRRKEVR